MAQNWLERVSSLQTPRAAPVVHKRWPQDSERPSAFQTAQAKPGELAALNASFVRNYCAPYSIFRKWIHPRWVKDKALKWDLTCVLAVFVCGAVWMRSSEDAGPTALWSIHCCLLLHTNAAHGAEGAVCFAGGCVATEWRGLWGPPSLVSQNFCLGGRLNGKCPRPGATPERAPWCRPA